MFDVGGPELLVILLAVLILFGPKKIPEIAQYVGKGMRKIKQAQQEFQSQINDFKEDINKTVYEEDNKKSSKPRPPDSKDDFDKSYKPSEGFQVKETGSNSDQESLQESQIQENTNPENKTVENNGLDDDTEISSTRRHYIKNNPYNLDDEEKNNLAG